MSAQTGPREPGCSLTRPCVRLALADRRVGHLWGEAIRFEAGSPQVGTGCEDWPGPTFPGWSVGRARLTLNQD